MFIFYAPGKMGLCILVLQIILVGVFKSINLRQGYGSYNRQKLNQGFTKRYGVNRLVYFETFDSIVEAIHREKQLKK